MDVQNKTKVMLVVKQHALHNQHLRYLSQLLQIQSLAGQRYYGIGREGRIEILPDDLKINITFTKKSEVAYTHDLHQAV